jgi:hypothetical protein
MASTYIRFKGMFVHILQISSKGLMHLTVACHYQISWNSLYIRILVGLVVWQALKKLNRAPLNTKDTIFVGEFIVLLGVEQVLCIPLNKIYFKTHTDLMVTFSVPQHHGLWILHAVPHICLPSLQKECQLFI